MDGSAWEVGDGTEVRAGCGGPGGWRDDRYERTEGAGEGPGLTRGEGRLGADKRGEQVGRRRQMELGEGGPERVPGRRGRSLAR